MVDFIPNERATPIRMPSTANLMIDSGDRSDFYSSPWDFQIQRTNSILNGFFTRIGTTEVVLEWCQPNIGESNYQLFVDVSGTGGNTFSGLLQGVLSSGFFYNIEDALDELVAVLNVDSVAQGAGVTFEVYNPNPGQAAIRIQVGDPGVFRITAADNTSTFLYDQLGFNKEDFLPNEPAYVDCPDLRLYRYLDFTSSQLTYNQDLKDTTTAEIVRDVLCRWYMAWDTPPDVDGYGFPILMGYTPFVLRRLFNPPKQIKWDPKQPVGNLAFQVFGNNLYFSEKTPIVAESDTKSNWLMTLQVSEI